MKTKPFESLRETFDCEQCKAFFDEIGNLTIKYELEIERLRAENAELRKQSEDCKPIADSIANSILQHDIRKLKKELEELKAQQEFKILEHKYCNSDRTLIGYDVYKNGKYFGFIPQPPKTEEG